MFRKLLLLLGASAAAAVAWFVWKQRDELRGEIERTRGEWRSGAAGKPRARVPVPGGNGPPPASEAVGEAVERCLATTRSGARCTRPAEPGSRHCWQHGG